MAEIETDYLTVVSHSVGNVGRPKLSWRRLKRGVILGGGAGVGMSEGRSSRGGGSEVFWQSKNPSIIGDVEKVSEFPLKLLLSVESFAEMDAEGSESDLPLHGAALIPAKSPVRARAMLHRFPCCGGVCLALILDCSLADPAGQQTGVEGSCFLQAFGIDDQVRQGVEITYRIGVNLNPKSGLW